MPGDLARYGEVLEIIEPKARLRIDRSKIAEVLSSVLASYSIEDVSVEDPPLEEVIADMFALSVKKKTKKVDASHPVSPQS